MKKIRLWDFCASESEIIQKFRFASGRKSIKWSRHSLQKKFPCDFIFRKLCVIIKAVSLTRCWRRNFSSNFAFFLLLRDWKICFYYFYINFHPRMLWIGKQAGDQRFTWPRSGARVCFQVCELLMPFECFVNFSLNKLFFCAGKKVEVDLMESGNPTDDGIISCYMEQASSSVISFFFV